MQLLDFIVLPFCAFIPFFQLSEGASLKSPPRLARQVSQFPLSASFKWTTPVSQSMSDRRMTIGRPGPAVQKALS